MSIRTVPGSQTSYALLAFDRHGAERQDDPDGVNGILATRVLTDLSSRPVTDIFMWCHGWQGDIPAAINQYDRWVGAFERQAADRAEMERRIPGFQPFHIGFHWPSQPWGDEEFGASGVAFDIPAAATESLVNTYTTRLGDTPAIRTAVETIVDEARLDAGADELSNRARAAYTALNKELDLGSTGLSGDAGSDREPFSPDKAMAAGQEASPDFGDLNLGGVLGPLRQLSFWTMKKRGQVVGESGVHDFLKTVQQAAPGARVHLMGHSFGCVVMSSALGGPGGTGHLDRPLDSCVLVQGAMSLWALSPDIPVQPGTAGYCHRIITEGRVRGPIVTTRSKYDRAVGQFYPIAAGAAGQVLFALALPRYGGIGAFGIQGTDGVDMEMLPTGQSYALSNGTVHNVECSKYICNGDGASGAHSDINGPQVAHLVWESAFPHP
jgi:hypothetical protein